jgi:hypothetical protein
MEQHYHAVLADVADGRGVEPVPSGTVVYRASKRAGLIVNRPGFSSQVFRCSAAVNSETSRN